MRKQNSGFIRFNVTGAKIPTGVKDTQDLHGILPNTIGDGRAALEHQDPYARLKIVPR